MLLNDRTVCDHDKKNRVGKHYKIEGECYEWGALDAGIISQNISLFCAATGLKTRPRASMDKGRIKELLKLKDSQYVFLNHPVGYSK